MAFPAKNGAAKGYTKMFYAFMGRFNTTSVAIVYQRFMRLRSLGGVRRKSKMQNAQRRPDRMKRSGVHLPKNRRPQRVRRERLRRFCGLVRHGRPG